MDFLFNDEQQAIIETARTFVQRELLPHEDRVERDGYLEPDLVNALRAKAAAAGLHSANMPQDVGGGGLDTLSWMILERELGHTGYALHMLSVARPSRILLACQGSQREQYLLPTVAGERTECLAMTEPEAGSDLRGMRTRAVRDGAGDDADWLITGTKHFISHADHADFIVLFAASGEREITAFLVDSDTPGLEIRPGYNSVSHRGYTNSILDFDGCRLPAASVLGEVGKGFDVANAWLGTTRLQVAATCLGRARRAHQLALEYACARKQFGKQISRNQAISFKLADMATALEAATLLTWRAAASADDARVEASTLDRQIAMAKVSATEALAKISDEAIQIHGGMGLMDELVLERIWRDSRVERIWDGTSEIQRHIISRSLLRPLGG